MHPIEHLLYFSVFALTWIIPVHPFIIVLTSLWFIAGPAPSHSGFDYITDSRGCVSVPVTGSTSYTTSISI